MKIPEVLTTGDVARLCGVAARTASKWIDLGRLQGYKLPNGHRRVTREAMLSFIRENGMESILTYPWEGK